jgi:hypothetical protein
VVRKAELDEQETRERLIRPAAKASAEDSQKSEELEMLWHQEEAVRAAKARHHWHHTNTNTHTHSNR